MGSTDELTYDAFISDPPPQDNGALPNGEPRLFPPLASTLISGAEDAVLVDPGFTTEAARALGDWVAGKDRNVTDIFIAHGHTAVDYFTAMVERHPDRLGRTVLWATAQAVFGIREHPGEDPVQFIAGGWL